ncbi:MAG: ThuA domain-containing protein [Planctomycetia bacterium]|nr:ThuA domain-containing protein [Planctomycetia bacterium]
MLRFLMILVVSLTLSGLTNCVDPVYSQEEQPLRILLVVGGHSYDKENLHKMLSDMPGSVLKEITLPEDQDYLKQGLNKDFDVVVFHDQSRFDLTEEQKTNMEQMWAEGMPTVMLHHALISHNDFPVIRDVFGTAFLLQEQEIDGRVRPASTYLVPTEVTLLMVDRKHPITEGVQDFTLTDEVFDKLYFNPKIDVLVTTDHPESSRPVVWTWHYKKTPVFGMIQGHDGRAFNNENYRKLFYNGLRWLVEESAER